MSNGKPAPSPNHEYLDLRQAAIICSVSDERFGKWIEKGVVPVIDVQGKKLIHTHDLIQHLVRYNIPIPDRLLQGKSRKILFVLADEPLPQPVITEIIWALYALRKERNFIFDFVRFDSTIELKIITFHPDRIILLQKEGSDTRTKRQIEKMLSAPVPITIFRADRTQELNQFFEQ